MKNLKSTRLLIDELVSIRKTISRPLSIVRLVTSTNAVNTLYGKRLTTICKELQIKYNEIDISKEYDFSDIYNKISALNKSDVTAILYDNPFANDGFIGQLTRHINPDKDIECITPLVYGKYALHDNPRVYPCFPQMLTQLMIMHGLDIEHKKILIVSALKGSHKDIILRENMHSSTITQTHIFDEDYLIQHIHGYDVIISLLFNFNKTISSEITTYTKLADKLILDFGYTSNCLSSSVDISIIDKSSTYYNLKNGLIDMYSITCIKNLLNKFK